MNILVHLNDPGVGNVMYFQGLNYIALYALILFDFEEQKAFDFLLYVSNI